MPIPKKSATLVFAPFSKVEKQDDGTLIVEGIASTERKDSDEEIIKADAVRAALPDYMQFANIREMHQPIAAGSALSASVDAMGVTTISAHIVDPTSVLKVETGVLKGFSLGGRILKRDPSNKKIITAMKIGEISLVDRPANPDCVIQCVKFDSSGRVVESESTKADEPNQASGAGAMRKSMYDVGVLAEIITRLNTLMVWAADEANWEGDESDVPTRLKASVADLCNVLRDMVDEETGELLGIADGIVAGDDMLTSAAKAIRSSKIVTVDFFADALNKKGAKFSKATVGALATVHKMLTNGCDMMEKLGYADTANQEEEETMKTETPPAGANAQGDQTDAIAKAQKSIDDLTAANADLTSRLEKAEASAKEASENAQKLADAIVAKGMVRVTKSEDAAPKKKDDDAVEKRDKTETPKDFRSELKSTWARPQSPIRGAATTR